MKGTVAYQVAISPCHPVCPACLHGIRAHQGAFRAYSWTACHREFDASRIVSKNDAPEERLNCVDNWLCAKLVHDENGFGRDRVLPWSALNSCEVCMRPAAQSNCMTYADVMLDEASVYLFLFGTLELWSTWRVDTVRRERMAAVHAPEDSGRHPCSAGRFNTAWAVLSIVWGGGILGSGAASVHRADMKSFEEPRGCAGSSWSRPRVKRSILFGAQ